MSLLRMSLNGYPATLKSFTLLRACLPARAMPLTYDIVCAMASVALLRKNPRMAHALLLAFVCLMRVGEIVKVTLGHFTFLKSDYAVLALPESKGGSRPGKPEAVVIRDPIVKNMLLRRCEAEGGEAPMLQATYGTFASEFKSLTRLWRLKQASVTPHGLKRGGATWHGSLYFSYDCT